jgi:hypothetical protein
VVLKAWLHYGSRYLGTEVSASLSGEQERHIPIAQSLAVSAAWDASLSGDRPCSEHAAIASSLVRGAIIGPL